MRVNVMFGIDHVEPECRSFEIARILAELSEKFREAPSVEANDTFMVRDINGNRIGVADVFGSR